MAKTQATAVKLGAALATLSVGTLLTLSARIRRAVNDLDAFNDLKDATGASIETISALDRVARETGGTFEQVSSILIKFNQALKDVDSNKRIASVFKALNLDAAELQRLDPAEALRRTAVAFTGFADDGRKARAAQDLFGRSIRETAPLLKDLSEKNELVATTSTRAAEEAEKFGKNMAQLRANTDDLTRSLANRLLPVLNRVFEDVSSFGEKANLAGLASDVLDAKKKVIEAENALKVLKERAASPFNFAGNMEKEVTAAEAQVVRARAVFNRAKELFNAADVNRPRSAGGGRGFVNPAYASTLPSLALPPEERKGTKGDPLAEAKRYLESLQKQIEATRNLTVYEQALTDITQKRLGALTPQLEKSILATARQVDAAQQAKAALEGMTRARELATQMQDRADEAALAGVAQHIEANQALREEIEMIGLSIPARAAVEQARLSSAIALKEEALAMAQNAEASATQISALEREIVLLKERAGLLKQRSARELFVEEQQKAKEFTDGVNADLKRAFMDAFASTDNPIKAFGESIYRTVSARISAALAESLASNVLEAFGLGTSGRPAWRTPDFNPSASGGGFLDSVGSILGGLFGGFRADGGPTKAGKLYRVNERGPELLNVGSKQYLMMGNQPGHVTPNRGAGGSDIQVINNFTLNAPTDNRTQGQIALSAQRGLDRARRLM